MFDVKFLNSGLLDDGYVCFLWCDIDEDVFGYGDIWRVGFSICFWVG